MRLLLRIPLDLLVQFPQLLFVSQTPVILSFETLRLTSQFGFFPRR